MEQHANLRSNPEHLRFGMSTENDDEWHAKEGVPRLDDPFIQQFLTGRDNLVQQEKSQRSDAKFREQLTPIAREACAIVDQIRFEEQQTLWTRDYEDSLADQDGDIYPGMMFSLAKERMEKSKLWKIVRKMPKGALLHCHFEAMVELEWLIDEMFATKDVYLKSEKSLDTPAAREKVPFTIHVPQNEEERVQVATHLSKASLWSEGYRPDSLVELKETAESFPDGGKAGFIDWMKLRCRITHRESVSHHDGPNAIWRKFMSCFAIVRPFTFHPPIFRKYTRKILEQLHADGVEWVDIRALFFAPALGRPLSAALNHFKIMKEEVEAFKSAPEGKGFWGVRAIWTIFRGLDKKQIIEGMKACIEVKKAFPDMLSGFDFVGQEDLGRPLQDLVPEIFWFRKRCAEEGLNIPFFFHAGETLGDGDETDENLFDAVLLGTRRVGHGFSLFKHPLLIDMVKDKKILIESCPISNEILRLTSSIKSHPLPALLARGVSVALCNDDPAIFAEGYTGVSHDFWQALQGWDNLGLAGLGSLAENSVRWAAFEDCTPQEWTRGIANGAYGPGIRAERLQEWMKAWESFCLWVVTEFGADYDYGKED